MKQIILESWDFSANLKMEFLTCGLQDKLSGYAKKGMIIVLLKKLIPLSKKENVEGVMLLRKLSY